ncbi:MAG: polyhydroxyalkanoate depolymerase [Geminicoccaceae bacterium]
MLYHAYEVTHAAMAPLRGQCAWLKRVYGNPYSPLSYTQLGKKVTAACNVFESVTKRYGKPAWGIDSTRIHGLEVPVHEEIVLSKPFCDLLHFDRDERVCGKRYDPKVLIVAPLSGHYATLLRGTVKAMIQEHNTYITDWTDARMVPLMAGSFDLDDYIDYVIDFIRFLGPNTHVIAVCQPSVPVLAAAALMNARNDPCAPASVILMGGPIDTRINPTAVNEHARNKSLAWFERRVIMQVPPPHPGFMRRVYPGFLQLAGFMSMNLDRHVGAHLDYFNHLIEGDCDSAAQHEAFYQEYLAVMDLSAEFFLQTIKTAFKEHQLPEGTMVHRGERVDCRAITRTALMTVEGEKDDITGLGQTEAAQELCSSLPPERRCHYVQPGVGHYGVFNGTRWRTEIQPRIREWIRTINFMNRRSEGARVSVPSVKPIESAAS